MINSTMRIYILLALLFCLSAKKNDGSVVKNLHQVSSELYRSGQPNGKGMVQLESMGIHSILNLREKIDDKQEIKNTNLQQIRIPIKTSKITYSDMVNALKAFHSAKKPVLIHCRRGSDRTGCFVACYRIVFQEWTKEKALEELLDPKYGYYDGMFPEIKEIVSTLDENKMRKDVLGE